MSPLHADTFSVDGKITSGEPRIALDSPDVSGNRRTASSVTSLNYGKPRKRVGPATFGGATPAAKRPLLAEERGDARYAASALPIAISLNYGTQEDMGECTTFGRATSAIKRPLLAEERGDARYVAPAPKDRSSSSPEPGRLGLRRPTTFVRGEERRVMRPLLRQARTL